MKFLLDENVEFRVVAFLRGEGYDVKTIVDDYQASLSDVDVLLLATTEQRVLITNDRDFSELIYRQHLAHTGIIFFRLPLDTTATQKITWLKQLFSTQADALGKFIVITAKGIRIRS